MFKITTWNVNSINVRLDQVLAWLQENPVDVLALQEIKCVDDQFPFDAFEALGYRVSCSGQKTYNGVAIVSRQAQSEVTTDIPDLIDPQRRILIAKIHGYYVVNLYVPNGSEPASEKYRYKLDWLAKVTDYLKQLAAGPTPLIVLGDFNIAPQDRDVHDPSKWEGSVLVSPAERAAFEKLLDIGLIDSLRHLDPSAQFTWWDYRRFAFKRDAGLRIDHILVSRSLADVCVRCTVDREARKHERPSDHAPVTLTLG